MTVLVRIKADCFTYNKAGKCSLTRRDFAIKVSLQLKAIMQAIALILAHAALCEDKIGDYKPSINLHGACPTEHSAGGCLSVTVEGVLSPLV